MEKTEVMKISTFGKDNGTMVSCDVVRRLFGLLRRLKQNPSLLREYDAVIRDQLAKGIIRGRYRNFLRGGHG